MAIYTFHMTCGHTAEREVAEPSKYYDIDRRYYEKQGLCDECWKKLHERNRRYRESMQRQQNIERGKKHE